MPATDPQDADATGRLARAHADRGGRHDTTPDPGCCDRCAKTILGARTRLDLNAGAQNGWHGTLCYHCAHELTFWLRDPMLMVHGPPMEAPAPAPRRNKQ